MTLEYHLRILPETSYKEVFNRMKGFTETSLTINEQPYIMLEKEKGGMELVHEGLMEQTRQRGIAEITSGRVISFRTNIRIG